MNHSQRLLDGVKRTHTSHDRKLCSKCWCVVNDPAQYNDHRHFEMIETAADRITMPQGRRVTLKGYLSGQNDKKEKDAVKLGVRLAFYQQRDPTLFVGGVQSGWEPDYLDSFLMRLQSQTFGSTLKSLPLTNWRAGMGRQRKFCS